MLALVMGLGVAACGDRDSEKDTAEVTETDTDADTDTDTDADTADGTDLPLYGAGMIDNDEDGFEQEVDCDDTDAQTFPGAAEFDSTTECMKDSDGDGYGDMTATSPVSAGTDCDDSDSDIHPQAAEVPADSKDNDCDGVVDESR